MKALTMDEITKLRADISVADLESAYAEALALLPLAALRKKSGTTQAEMASRLGKSQAAVSKFEGRGDFLLSTLYRHVSAIGGKLLVEIKTDSSRYELKPADLWRRNWLFARRARQRWIPNLFS